MRLVDTAIVGGGPAGAAAACVLARAGCEVVVLERSAGPRHKVCGEFLSVETQAQLHRLGLDPARLGAASIDRIGVHSGSRSATAELPFRAASLSRYRLDNALLAGAQALGAQVRRAVSVRSVGRQGEAWTVDCDDGERLHCRHLVLATGKLGLRGIDDARDASLVGLKMHMRLAEESRRSLAGRVELFLLDRSYAGLELVEEGIGNLCLVLPRAVVARLAPDWPALHAYLGSALPRLAARLDGAEPLWAKALAVVCPAAGHLHREAQPACYRVGDRLAHMPPFAGDGLAVALGSGMLAAEHIARGQSPADYLAAARRLTGGPIRLASAVSALAAGATGRAVLLGAAAMMPGLLGTLARRTRLPLAAR